MGTDPGRRHDVLPLDAVRALLILPGPEVTRLAVDVSAGTALANVRAPAIEGLKVTDLLVDPGEQLLRAGEPFGGLGKGRARRQEQCGREQNRCSHVVTKRKG